MISRLSRFAHAVVPAVVLLALFASCGEGNGRRVAERPSPTEEPQIGTPQQPAPGDESEAPVEGIPGVIARSVDRDVSGGLGPVGTVDPDALVTTSPARWGRALIVGTASGELVATGVDDREELWRTGFDDALDALAATSTALFTASGASVHRVSPVTGEIEWSVTLDGGRAVTPLTVTSTTVYLGLLDGSVAACDVRDGAVRWRAPAGGVPVGRMILVDGRLYLATQEGDLVAFDGSDGSRQWRRALGGGVAAGPTDLGGRIAVATIDGEITIFGLEGETFDGWRIDAAPVLASIVGNARRLVVVDGAGAIHAFEPDGTPAWRGSLGSHLAGDPARIGDGVFAGEASGGLVAVGLRSGEVISRVAFGAAPVREAIVLGDELAWVLADGTVRRVSVDGDVEQSPLFSSEGSWVLPESGTFRLQDERVALTMRSDEDAVFEITVSAAPAEDLVLRVVSSSGATVATNMGKVELGRSVRAALDGGASYELVIERPDPAGEIMISVETRQLD
ncbi:MAG: PQQ-binding-like beta-propeller repeat protein [Spirochaetota bacterium]